jgi:predicted nucleic acid-binding protein
MILVDMGPVVALADENDSYHQVAVEAFESITEQPVLSPLCVAEIDFLLSRSSRTAALAFVRDVAWGRFQVECLENDEWALVQRLAERYADLAPGLADLSLVVLAHRFRTDRILTFDQRHFRAMHGVDERPFRLLPADA